MNKKTIWVTVLVAVIAVAAIWYFMSMNPGAPASYNPSPNNNDGAPTSTPSSTPVTPAAPVVGAGEHCGGNMLNAPVCAPGYECMPSPDSHLPFGDVGGLCVAQGKG